MTGRILRFRAVTETVAWEQSDRPYPPYLPQMSSKMHWFDAATGVEGWTPLDRLTAAATFRLASGPRSSSRKRVGRSTAAARFYHQ